MRAYGKIPWRRRWHPTPAYLPGKSHGQRSLGGLRSTGLKSRTQRSHQPTTAEGLPMGPWSDRVAVLLRRDSRGSLSLSGFLFTPRKDHARHSEGGCHLQARKSSHQKPINESLDLGLLAPRTARKSKLLWFRSLSACCLLCQPKQTSTLGICALPPASDEGCARKGLSYYRPNSLVSMNIPQLLLWFSINNSASSMFCPTKSTLNFKHLRVIFSSWDYRK